MAVECQNGLFSDGFDENRRQAFGHTVIIIAEKIITDISCFVQSENEKRKSKNRKICVQIAGKAKKYRRGIPLR